MSVELQLSQVEAMHVAEQIGCVPIKIREEISLDHKAVVVLR